MYRIVGFGVADVQIILVIFISIRIGSVMNVLSVTSVISFVCITSIIAAISHTVLQV